MCIPEFLIINMHMEVMINPKIVAAVVIPPIFFLMFPWSTLSKENIA